MALLVTVAHGEHSAHELGVKPALPLIALVALSAPSSAQDLACQGILPFWSLNLQGANATLLVNQETALSVELTTHAEGRDWPRALTLVGETDTAILLVEREQCRINQLTRPYQAQVLTQIGVLPVLLTGCCEPRP